MKTPEEKQELRDTIKLGFIAFVIIYFIVVNFVYSCKNDDKTAMQVLKHTPKSLILDFDE